MGGAAKTAVETKKLRAKLLTKEEKAIDILNLAFEVVNLKKYPFDRFHHLEYARIVSKHLTHVQLEPMLYYRKCHERI